MNIKNILVVAAILAGAAVSAATFESGRTEIVIAKDAPKTVAFAAKEMKHFLDGVLGADVPIVNAPTAGKSPIFLGANEWTKAAGIDVAGLKRDAFRIVVTEKGAFVAGRDDPKADPERALVKNVWSQLYERATLFGAYEFLEHFAGVRMYFPGELGEVVPRKEALAVPAADLTVAPEMPTRRYSVCNEGVWFEGEKRDVKSTWRGRWLNYYRLRAETSHVPFCHGLNHRGYLARFADTHPEYFAMNADGSRNVKKHVKMSGQLCHTSDVWEEIYRDAKSYLKGEAPSVRGIVAPNGSCSWWYGCQDRKYVDIMPQDGMQKCACAKCRAAFDADDAGNYMDTLIWSQTAKVARRLTAEGIDGYVTQMAYQPYRRVPDVDLPANVLVMVAERGPWSMPFPDQLTLETDEIAAWAKKLGHKVWIWTYPCKYGKRKIPNVPDLSPRCWGQYYKLVAQWVQGEFAESETDRFLFRHLDHYLLSRITWNSSVDPDAILDEYYRLMYGSAAGELKAFFESLEDKWVKGVLGHPVDTIWGPSFSPVERDEMWNTIYTDAVLADYAKLLDRAAAKTAPGSLERRRVELMRREFLDPLAHEAKEFRDRAAKLSGIVHRLGEGNVLKLVPNKIDRGATEAPAGWAPTTATVVEKDGGLVLKVHCEEPRIADSVATEHAFDGGDIWKDDNIEIMVDPTGMRREFVHFIINSLGSYGDMRHVKDGRRWKLDAKWNSGADVKVVRGAAAWDCEVRIPAGAFMELGRRFCGEIYRGRLLKGMGRPEYSAWSPYVTNPCDIDNFGYWEK